MSEESNRLHHEYQHLLRSSAAVSKSKLTHGKTGGTRKQGQLAGMEWRGGEGEGHLELRNSRHFIISNYRKKYRLIFLYSQIRSLFGFDDESQD